MDYRVVVFVTQTAPIRKGSQSRERVRTFFPSTAFSEESQGRTVRTVVLSIGVSQRERSPDRGAVRTICFLTTPLSRKCDSSPQGGEPRWTIGWSCSLRRRLPSRKGATSSGQPSLASSSSESSSWSALRESRMVSGRCAPGITNMWSPLASSHASTTRW